MGLSQALSIAMSGLRATQASLALVSSNIANAETPGYTSKTVVQVAGQTGDYGSSVLLNGVNRQLDAYLQSQIRTETSGAAYADVRSTFLANLQTVYGNPDDTGTIEDAFNKFLTAVQGLSTSPDSQSARIGVVNAAQTMAQQLNATTQGIQNLRANAETGISDSVTTANNAMAQIAAINNQLQNSGQTDASTAALLDQRDQYVNQLSQLMDIRTVTNNLNQVTVFTNSGVQLVGTEAAKLSFNAQGTVTPNTLYNSNPTQSNVGTITINFPHGGSYDMVSNNSIRSGKIAAYLDLRDNTLVQAQAQIDQFAASMSSALSDKTTDGVAAPASVAPAAGFDVDLTGMESGNVVHVTYKDNTTGATHNLSIVRVDDPSVLPLGNNATLEPNDEVLGVDFSGGMGSVVSQLNAALGTTANLQFSSPSGSTLRVLDDGVPNRSDVIAASVTTTMSSLTSGNPS
jgi:flagellar hook-associated protein 1